MLTIAAGLTVLAVLATVYAIFNIGRRDPRLPPGEFSASSFFRAVFFPTLTSTSLPGPPTLPIIGNLHQIPTKRTHLQFAQWAKQYGEIYSLKFGPATSIVVSSPRLVKQLLDKKSNLYSRRPPSHVGDLIAQGDHLLLMQYSDQWRPCRKLVHQYFREEMVNKHHVDVVDAEAVQMLSDFLSQPEGCMRHPKRFSNSIIMSLSEQPLFTPRPSLELTGLLS